MNSKLCGDKKKMATKLSLPVCPYSYLFAFKAFSYSAGYMHLNTLIHLAEITLKYTHI